MSGCVTVTGPVQSSDALTPAVKSGTAVWQFAPALAAWLPVLAGSVP